MGAGPDGVQPEAGRAAADIVGVTPTGERIEIHIDGVGGGRGSLLIAFLTARCDGCDIFWQGFGERRPSAQPPLPPDVTPVIVTKGPKAIDPAEVVRLGAATGDVAVVMSDAAWDEYRVFGYPFFVLVDVVTRTVVAETVGFGWDDLVEFVERSR